ncbi:MAG: DUF4157 domain-containing protein [Ilumatobacteraceae bacterium]
MEPEAVPREPAALEQQVAPPSPVRERVVRRAPSDQQSMWVGAVDDPAERQADALADAAIARMHSAPSTIAEPAASRVRRAPQPIRREPAPGERADEADPDGEPGQSGGGAEDEAAEVEREEGQPAGEARIQRSATAAISAAVGTLVHPTGPRIQRAARAAELAAGHGAAGGALEHTTEQRIRRTAGRGDALDDETRARMEHGFGTGFGDITVHRDAEAADLNRSLNARAFAVGRDVYFGKNEYRPGSAAGDRLIAHELAHTVSSSGGPQRAVHRRSVIRRRFEPAVIASKAHLRQRDAWDTFHGPTLATGTHVLVDDSATTRVIQTRSVLPNVTWRPAVTVAPATRGPVAANRQGYIRSSRATLAATSLRQLYYQEISTILATAEQRMPNGNLVGQLAKPAHIDFLIDKALRYDNWNSPDPSVAVFVSGLGSLQPKLDRIREGAEHVADTLEHWRKWLHPGQAAQVSVVDVKFMKSDLHEHGLGVLDVKFRKPLGGNAKFATDTDVEAMIKPEDKSLEQALLGSEPTSAANRLNTLAGLAGNERLGTMKMEAMNTAGHGMTPVYSTLIEKVQGISSEDMVGGDKTKKSKGAFAVTPSFYETLVFAFLAGLDDLHWENVMWVNGTPYMIDADAAMMQAQMTKTSSGDSNQSGFSTVNVAEATQSLQGIKENDPAKAKSKILNMMVTDPVNRALAITAIQNALANKKGRTVPIYTERWKKTLLGYQQAADKDAYLDFHCARGFLVRDGKALDGGFGPGLAGTTGINVANDVYNTAAERAELKKDLDAGSIPFYEYDFSTGAVSHNGVHIFNGLTLAAAIPLMAARF